MSINKKKSEISIKIPRPMNRIQARINKIINQKIYSKLMILKIVNMIRCKIIGKILLENRIKEA
jgi:hypothetical protein